MWNLICKILWVVILIVNVATLYISLGEKKSKCDGICVLTSAFVWLQGLFYMLQYVILGEI